MVEGLIEFNSKFSKDSIETVLMEVVELILHCLHLLLIETYVVILGM